MYSGLDRSVTLFSVRILEVDIAQFAVARATPTMVTNMRGGFFLFFAGCITIMLVAVFFLVPETKGRTLEGMDEVFGSAYGDLGETELSTYRREAIRARSDDKATKQAPFPSCPATITV